MTTDNTPVFDIDGPWIVLLVPMGSQTVAFTSGKVRLRRYLETSLGIPAENIQIELRGSAAQIRIKCATPEYASGILKTVKRQAAKNFAAVRGLSLQRQPGLGISLTFAN